MVGDCVGASVKRLSAIDIGTNTILMLIADVDPIGEIHVVRDEHAIARLGKGVDGQGKIFPDTFDRVLRYLFEYKKIHEAEHSQRIVACGTSALRDAANRDEFVRFIKERLGFEISILSGDEEARLTYLGGISEFVASEPERRYAVLDIGGGSTELTYGQGTAVHSESSVDVGSVRLTERRLKKSPPDPSVLNDTRQYVAEHLRQLPKLSSDARCIGVAGTLTTLAALDLDLTTYDRNRVSGHVMTLGTVEGIFDRLKVKSLEELWRIPQILPERADILLAGILILTEVMKTTGIKEITVSDRGLRYGILMQAARERDN